MNPQLTPSETEIIPYVPLKQPTEEQSAAESARQLEILESSRTATRVSTEEETETEREEQSRQKELLQNSLKPIAPPPAPRTRTPEEEEILRQMKALMNEKKAGHSPGIEGKDLESV
ncbi:MAG: hypothetical protein AAF514_18925 [Verrucomicrobiota bacterium]